MGKSKPPQHVGNIPMLTPEQQGLQNNVIGQLNNQFSNLSDDQINLSQNPLYQQATGNLEEVMRPRTNDQLSQQFNTQIGTPAVEQFNRSTIPGLMSSFAELGAGRSSALNQALAAASKDLSTGHASQRQQYLTDQRSQQLQAGQAAMGAAGMPLQSLMQLFGPSLHNAQTPIVKPYEPGLTSQLLTAAAGGAGAYFGAKK